MKVVKWLAFPWLVGRPTDIVNPPWDPDGDFYEIVQNERRRWMIDLLTTFDGWIDIGDLAEVMADHENEEATTSDRKACYTSIYQSHIPRMESAGVIETDGRVGEIRANDRTHLYADALAAVSEAGP